LLGSIHPRRRIAIPDGLLINLIAACILLKILFINNEILQVEPEIA